MFRSVLFLVVTVVAAHGGHDQANHHHHHHHHRLPSRSQHFSCISDNDCFNGKECFQEIDEETSTGVCLRPNPHIDSLVLHCGSNFDCPSLHECVATATKTRGVCRPVAKAFNKAPKVFVTAPKSQDLDEVGNFDAVVETVGWFGSDDLDDLSDLDDLDERPLADRTAPFSPSDLIVPEDLGEHDNDDHCGDGPVFDTVLSGEEEEEDDAPAAHPSFFRRLRGQPQCTENKHAEWQGNCANPAVRDAYTSRSMQGRQLKLVHAVFLNEKGEWPSKNRTRYDPLTLEDLQFQTRELEQFFAGSGIEFNASVKTVVDDTMYHSHIYKSGVPATTKSALNDKVLANDVKVWPSQRYNALPMNHGERVTKGTKLEIKFEGEAEDKVDFVVVLCSQSRDVACETRINSTIAGRKSEGPSAWTTLPMKAATAVKVTTARDGVPILIFRSAHSAVKVTPRLLTTHHLVTQETVINRFGSGENALHVYWFPVYYPDSEKLFRLNGFGNFPGDQFTGRMVVHPKRAYETIEGTSQRPSTTLAHELGHVFGLLHTHQGWTSSQPYCPCAEHAGIGDEARNHISDFCADTPPQPQARSNSCSVPEDRGVFCGEKFEQQNLTNIMSYSSCRSLLTPNQVGRMKCFITENAVLNRMSSGGFK